MIRSHIGFIRNCRVVFKLEMFSHISGQSFGLSSFIRLVCLSLVLSLEPVHSGKGLLGTPREAPE